MLTWAPLAFAQAKPPAAAPENTIPIPEVIPPVPVPVVPMSFSARIPPIPVVPPGQLLDDFSAGELGQFPLHWRPKGKNANHFYTVGKEESRHYLKVDAVLDGTWIGREVKWDIEAYPILEWSWRARLLPKNGNEMKDSGNDCTVAISVVFPIRFFVPDTLKYSWSTTLPIGTEFSNGGGFNKIRVLRSGEEMLGQWVIERRNVAADYKRRFHRQARNPIGLGIITDADNTHSASSGDYAYFKVLNLDESKELILTP